MPIYEYQCQHCGEVSEAVQKVSDTPLTDCTQCGNAALKRLLSANRFSVERWGWYETDFKGGRKKI